MWDVEEFLQQHEHGRYKKKTKNKTWLLVEKRVQIEPGNDARNSRSDVNGVLLTIFVEDKNSGHSARCILGERLIDAETGRRPSYL